MLHVEFLLPKEDALNELVKVFVIMADQCLNLIRLRVGDNLVLYDFPIGWIRKHEGQDRKGQNPRLLDKDLVCRVKANEERTEEYLRVQIALAKLSQSTLKIRFRLLKDAIDERFVGGSEGALGKLSCVFDLNVGSCLGFLISRSSGGLLVSLDHSLHTFKRLAQLNSVNHAVDKAFEVHIFLDLVRLPSWIATIVANIS